MNTVIDNVTFNQAIDEIDRLIKKRKCAYVVTPNVDHIVRLEKDDELKEIYGKSSLSLADGQPLLWISALYGQKIVEKISGSDLFPAICKLAHDKGYSLFLLGAEPGVAEIAADNIIKKYPNAKIAGTYSPNFGFENDEEEQAMIVRIITSCKPDILVLGLGSPKQERYIYNNVDALKVPVTLCIGASIDFMAGKIKRAPRWMSNNGLEWLYRLLNEPRRLFRRYLVDDLKIICLILKYWPCKKK